MSDNKDGSDAGNKTAKISQLDKNIHFGPISLDEAKDDGLTVGDLSVVTEAKRKEGRS